MGTSVYVRVEVMMCRSRGYWGVGFTPTAWGRAQFRGKLSTVVPTQLAVGKNHALGERIIIAQESCYKSTLLRSCMHLVNPGDQGTAALLQLRWIAVHPSQHCPGAQYGLCYLYVRH